MSWTSDAWSSWRWCPRWTASGPCPGTDTSATPNLLFGAAWARVGGVTTVLPWLWWYKNVSPVARLIGSPPWPSCKSMHLIHLTLIWWFWNSLCNRICEICDWVTSWCWSFNYVKLLLNSYAYFSWARSFVVIATPLKVWRAFGTGINGHIQNLEVLHTKQLDELDELDQIAKSNSSTAKLWKFHVVFWTVFSVASASCVQPAPCWKRRPSSWTRIGNPSPGPGAWRKTARPQQSIAPRSGTLGASGSLWERVP